MERQAAIEELAAGDPRPLMIFLADHESGDKVKSLLDAALKSERFQLASKWFHCVQVTKDVLQKDHPYHSLFDAQDPPRLLLASRDGKKLVPFLGNARQKVSWSGISGVLRNDYKKDPTTAVKSIERLLSKFDALDDKRKELNAQLAKASQRNQKSRIAKIEAELAANEKGRADVFAEKERLEKLELRNASTD